MSDKELLKLAAKAAGINYGGYCEKRGLLLFYENLNDTSTWNPLTDDGDALRLAVKLKLDILLQCVSRYAYADSDEYDFYNGNCTKVEDCNNDQYAATRRAIVRAAAEIGKAM